MSAPAHPATVGELIEHLGAEMTAGRIGWADAVAAIRAADPALSRVGAEGQLRAWRGAGARWAHAAHPARIEARPVDARALTARTPIRIRFNQEATR